MKSMTGYGFAESITQNYAITVELKSYNSRYLEIEMNIPPALGKLEEKVRRTINEKAARGRVELFVRVKDFSESLDVVVNAEAVKAYQKALATIIETAGIQDQIHLAHLMRLDGLMKSFSANQGEKFWPLVEPLLAEALGQFEASRNTEGENIQRIIIGLIADFEKELGQIKTQEPAYKEKIKLHVRERFQEILGNEVDETRVMQEIAVLLLKSDIHEEIIRLESHLSTLRDTISGAQPVGKRFDFLCQELNREVNTIGSKSFVYEINKAVINCKEIIERMRELLRNVE